MQNKILVGFLMPFCSHPQEPCKRGEIVICFRKILLRALKWFMYWNHLELACNNYSLLQFFLNFWNVYYGLYQFPQVYSYKNSFVCPSIRILHNVQVKCPICFRADQNVKCTIFLQIEILWSFFYSLYTLWKKITPQRFRLASCSCNNTCASMQACTHRHTHTRQKGKHKFSM